jgi:hypothetical protein
MFLLGRSGALSRGSAGPCSITPFAKHYECEVCGGIRQEACDSCEDMTKRFILNTKC